MSKYFVHGINDGRLEPPDVYELEVPVVCIECGKEEEVDGQGYCPRCAKWFKMWKIRQQKKEKNRRKNND